jgi:hypothetical protein
MDGHGEQTAKTSTAASLIQAGVELERRLFTALTVAVQ